MAIVYQDLGPLASKIDAWVAQVFPDLNCRERTTLTLAISRLGENYMVQVDKSGREPWLWSDMYGMGDLFYHGANINCLSHILKEGLAESVGSF